MKDDLTKYKNNDSDLYHSLASPFNATSTCRFDKACFMEVGTLEACFMIECLAEI